MKIFKNKAVAILIMVAAIVLSSLYGLSKRPAVEVPEGGAALDASLSTAAFEQYIVDQAGVLSAKTEKSLSLYNANWDRMAGSIMAVVTVKNTSGGAEDAAWDWADQLQLGVNDAILLLDVGSGDYSVAASGTFYDRLDAQSVSFVDACLLEYVQRADYDSGTLNLFGQVHLLFGAGHTDQTGGVFSIVGAIIPIIILLIVLIVLFNIIDGIRYRSWYSRYGGMGVPPVVYRPILWWHRPGTSWYRRRRTPPPPPRGPGSGPRPPMGNGPRPPMGGGTPPRSGTPRSGSFGGSGRGGDFGSGPRPPRGGGTPPRSGTPRSGSFGGSGRGGGFGSGPRPPMGGGTPPRSSTPRGGSFGGSGRGGSFGGSPRSGSFGGGSRGGGFGGSRGGRR